MADNTNPARLAPSRQWRIVHTESSLGWGGQEHRILAELVGFQRRGGAVWLVAPMESEIYQRAVRADIPVRQMKFSRGLLPSNVLRLARWLRREHFSVLNPHSSRDAWVAGLAGRLANAPLIIRTRHIDVSYPNRWISRQAFTSLADHVVTTSGKISAHFRETFHLPADRVSTVPTGIDLELFSPAGAKASLLPTAADAQVPLVGMISVLRSWKGHLTFLQAAQRLRAERFSARFVIVGEGPYRPWIEGLIADLKLADTVTLIGHREDVPAVLRSLDALVIASTQHEGVPQIGLQALATRTPVIGSDAGGTPEIVRHGQTGRLFPPGDFAALAAAIRDTLEKSATTRRLCEQGRAFVENDHSLEHMLDKLEAIYCRHLAV